MRPTPTLIDRLFQNLIGNAIKFRRRPRRRASTSPPSGGSGEWIFTVRDNGIGFDPEHAERIFVIFQRLHSATSTPAPASAWRSARRSSSGTAAASGPNRSRARDHASASRSRPSEMVRADER